jgi:hypothetical protein
MALATFAAISLPFLAADSSSFLHDVLFFQLDRLAPPLVTEGGAFGLTLNPSLSGLMVTLIGHPAPLYLSGTAALVVMALLLYWRNPRAKIATGQPTESELTSSMVLRSSLCVAISVFVIPSVFFFAYLELPIVLFLIWLASR